MIFYRIHTEYVTLDNLDEVITLVKTMFPTTGANFVQGTGLWHGKTENSLVIEYIGSIADYPSIELLARAIKTLNNQEAVLITLTNCQSVTV